MTGPLLALAVGAVLAGFVGIPAALGGGNAIEHFLAPSFGQLSQAGRVGQVGLVGGQAGLEGREGQEAEHESTATELGLMLFSIVVAGAGIGLAYRFYIQRPEIAAGLAERFAGAHRLLTNKLYVDELYNATVIKATMASGRGLWTVDRLVVDGTVNASSRLTVVGAWFSALTDRRLVDGLVNAVGWVAQESSYGFRRLQTGLVQNYALVMLLGVALFIGVYLVVR
jgi:NADH-quinone oxidoreductase subunit L